jgi:mono/diheme cytochrome c family protein
MFGAFIRALGLLTLLAACGEQSPAYPPRRPAAGLLGSAAGRAAGGAIFHSNCAICHGTPREGRSPRADFFEPPAPDFLDPRYRTLDPAYLYWRIETGKTAEPFLSRGSVMPAWGPHFSEEQIWQLVAYLRSRSGA